MAFILEALKLVALLIAIFLVVYLPIEKMTKNKAWYYRGLSLIIFGFVCFLYAKYLGGRIECYLEHDRVKCGLTSTVISFVFALFFELMGLVWLIKDKITQIINKK